MGKRILCSLAVLFVLFAISSRQTLEAAEQPYFQGKIITILVGYSPGGGYDRITRIVARHMPKYIPGRPSVVVQNMPGAGSMIVANHLYNLARPDGLTIGIFNRGLPFAQLLNAPGVKFDMPKYSWLGSAAIETTTLALHREVPYKTLDDILKSKQPLMIGSAGGPSDSNTQFVMLLQQFLGMNVKLINYPASAEVILAIERREVDGVGMSFNSIKPFVDRGLIRPWIRGRFSEPEIESLPVDEDLTTDKTGKTIMAIRSSVDGIGRPFVAAPGTPEPIMKDLRQAFAKALKDPALKEDAKKNKMIAQFVSPEECMRLVKYILEQPDDIVREAKKYIKF